MNIRNVLISILFVGVSTILIGCSNQCKDRYIWSPRTIIITPEEVRVNDLIIMDGNVDYKTSQKAGVPYCWPKND